MDPSELDGFHAAAVYQHAEINAPRSTDPKSSRQRASGEEYRTLRSARPFVSLADSPLSPAGTVGKRSEVGRLWPNVQFCP